MRVGGEELDPDYIRRLTIGLTVVVTATGVLISVSAAILFGCCFIFGVCIMSIALDLSPGHQLPNFLSYLRPPPLLPPISCQKCSKVNCISCLHGEPWAGYKIPVEIDQALEKFFERILREYVYSWYREVSYDQEFVQEIRHCLRYATAILLKRVHRVNVSQLIVKKAIPEGLVHVDSLLKADKYRQSLMKDGEISGGYTGRKGGLSLKEAFVDCMGPSIHPAAHKRAKEVEYVRNAAKAILPHLVPERFQNSKALCALVTDILSGAVLQPLMDILPNPDMCINLLIDLGFSPEPSKKFGPPSGERVEYLDQFVMRNHSASQSALIMDLSSILKNNHSFYAFLNFLRREDQHALHQLMLCHSVEDFTKKDTDDLKSLGEEGMVMYLNYLEANAKHKVNVSPSIVEEICAILVQSKENPEAIVLLRGSDSPLFRAYEEVYRNLESKMCPSFHRSSEYFEFLVGNRQRGEELEPSDNKAKEKDVSKTDKFGRGLTKIKQGVFGSKEEGIIETTDTGYYGGDGDETLTGGSVGKFRDMSSWRVSIPRLVTSKHTPDRSRVDFVFILDIRSSQDSDLHFCVERVEREFYALESKLTEFHGELDTKLPPRSKFPFNKGLDTMQAKRKPFEEYVVGLLQKPELKGSEMLFTFLTSKQEFTEAASNLPGIGKITKSVQNKLVKEKGQALQPFIDNFLLSTQSQPRKPRFDSVVNTSDEHDATSERVILKHPVFGDGFGILDEPKYGASSFHRLYHLSEQQEDEAEVLVPDPSEVTTVFDTLVYLAWALFNAKAFVVRMMNGIGILVRNTFEHLVDYAIATKLSQVLSVNRMAFLCKLTEDAIFEENVAPRTDEDKLRRKKSALNNFQAFVRPLIQWCVGRQDFESGTKFIFEGLQDPIINKHLAFRVLDLLLAEIFPELQEKT